jgi:hypothetical protein
MRRSTALVLFVAVSTASITVPAQPGRRPGGVRAPATTTTTAATPGSPTGPGSPTTRRLTLREAVAHLQSANSDEVLEAVDALVVIRTAEVVPPMVELIHRGLQDSMLETVVEKLGLTRRPEAIDELSSLLHHRRSVVRQNVVGALALIPDNRVRPLIESALRDSDGSVRSAAARSLGEINARQSLELLQRAFERNVPEAAQSIGRLGDGASARRLLQSVGRSPLSVLLPGFRAFLDRRDIDDPTKLHIVEQLAERASTGQTREFLREWERSLPSAFRSPSRLRAQRAIREIQDSPTPAATAPGTQGGAR